MDLCADRYIKLQYQGVGAQPWILERRNGLARGIYGRQLISDVQFCLGAMLSTTGLSAYHPEFGSNPADNFGRGDGDENLLFAQDASLSGQFVAQRGLRIVAQKAALTEIANSEMRGILAFKNSFDGADVSADVSVGDKAPSRKSAPRWMSRAPRYPFEDRHSRWPVTA